MEHIPNKAVIPYWCLLDILKFLNRNDLERIQVTSRLLSNVIKKDFVTYPLRVMPDSKAVVQIRNGELVLSIHKYRVGSCFMPDVRAWSHNNCTEECDHFYSVEVVRQFLYENVRFRHGELFIHDHHIFKRYSVGHIATLESISHIWARKHLVIYDFSEKEPSSQSLILSNSAILQCRTLHVHDNRRRIQVLQYPNIYSLYALDITGSISSSEILPLIQQLIKQKACYRDSETIFMFHGTNESVSNAVDFIKQNFFASQDYCRLRLMIKIVPSNDIEEFREMNYRTNEVLQLKHISKEQINEFDIRTYRQSGAMMIERYIISSTNNSL